MEMQVPAGMSPIHAVELLQERLNRYAKDVKNFACCNASITVIDPSYDMVKKEVHPGDLIFSEEHCRNQKRNGSKYCQSCSDKHHGITPAISEA